MQRLLLRLSLAALLGGASPLDPTAHAANANVGIDNFTFSPAEITVAAGTTVTWTNNDDVPHTVTDADSPRKFTSAAMDTGETYGVTFTAPGIYHYFCSLHTHMQGTVVVR